MTSKNKPSGSGSISRALQLWVAVALLVVLLVAASRLQACAAASGFCASKCAVRCGRASGKGKVPACMKRCGLCCVECASVPTATGRSDECPCYRNMLTAGSRKMPKCPD